MFFVKLLLGVLITELIIGLLAAVCHVWYGVADAFDRCPDFLESAAEAIDMALGPFASAIGITFLILIFTGFLCAIG